VLHVRTPHEHAALGHLPGATLLPVDLIVCGPAVLDAADPAPVLVYCEHGIRSRHAAAVLAQAGFSDVLNLTHGMAAWRGAREFGDAPVAGPSPWLLEHADLLRPGSRVLDVACGAGRHALLFASAAFPTRAVDRDGRQIDRLRTSASALGLSLQAEVADLEVPDPDLGDALYEVVLVVHYLHRPLFPALRRALAPGGLLIYETFLEAHAGRYGRPSNPSYLLKPGELATLVAPLEIVRSFEGESNGRIVAAVVARKGTG
jgi:rhodanese-related sulfurtransferase